MDALKHRDSGDGLEPEPSTSPDTVRTSLREVSERHLAATATQVLAITDDPTRVEIVRAALAEVGEHGFVVAHAADEVLAEQALGNQEYACIVFWRSDDRTTWSRFIRGRRHPRVPIVYVDETLSTEDRVARRRAVLDEGAWGYVRADELTGPMLEAAIFHALERAQLQQSIAQVQERFALAVRGSNDGVWEWILGTDEVHFSRRWRELLGYGVDDLRGELHEWLSRVHPDDLEGLKTDLDAHVGGSKPFHEHEHRIRAGDGEYRWVITRGVVQRDPDGRATRMAGSLTDTSDFRVRDQRLLEESRHDALTNLPRREPFLERLRACVDLAREYDDYAFSVLVVDVDRFRWLTDSIGHRAADKMLAILARRLGAAVRPGDMLARFDGDMFVVLLDRMGDPEVGSQIADRIRRSVSEPFVIDGQTLYATVSIGLTTSARGYEDASEAVNDAAAAANKAKESGHDRYAVFETKMRLDAISHLRLEVALRQAVERQEFELHYQPIVGLDGNNLVGFEALVRWRHRRRGLVPPGEFIPLAEQTGLIVPLGRWVIREAVEQLARWQVEEGASKDLTMSVNLSGRQVADPRLREEIESIIATHGLRPGALRLELTESVLVENATVVHRFLTALRDAGVRIWVDDFGTGYSSLSYLHRFPVDGLKIDKAFVETLDGSQGSATMVRTILSLAESLGVGVVAEGIEEPVQAEQLRGLGCDRGQGYLFSRPVEPHEIPRLLRRGVLPAPATDPTSTDPTSTDA